MLHAVCFCIQYRNAKQPKTNGDLARQTRPTSGLDTGLRPLMWARVSASGDVESIQRTPCHTGKAPLPVLCGQCQTRGSSDAGQRRTHPHRLATSIGCRTAHRRRTTGRDPSGFTRHVSGCLSGCDLAAQTAAPTPFPDLVTARSRSPQLRLTHANPGIAVMSTALSWFFRRLVRPRSPYATPIQPLQVVIGIAVAAMVALVAAVTYLTVKILGLAIALVFRRR